MQAGSELSERLGAARLFGKSFVDIGNLAVLIEEDLNAFIFDLVNKPSVRFDNVVHPGPTKEAFAWTLGPEI
jgi:hypothetical protein